MRKYGKVGVLTYFGVSTIALGGWIALVYTGVPVVSLLEYLGMADVRVKSKRSFHAWMVAIDSTVSLNLFEC
jgi:hypothetical protein